MHYKNGRPAEIGDIVVGKSHNSQRVILAYVKDLMPGQGNCNLKLETLGRLSARDPQDEGNFLHVLGVGGAIGQCKIAAHEDYGDAASFVTVEDGYRLACAAELGHWQSGYFVG